MVPEARERIAHDLHAGRAIRDTFATTIWVRAIRRSKWAVLPGWHCLRHSFISNCAAWGVDQRLIDHWVGHTTEAMRRRYSHLLPAVSQAAHRCDLTLSRSGNTAPYHCAEPSARSRPP
jgi:integrase